MWIADKGRVDPLLLLVTLLAERLLLRQTLNCIYDRDIDYEMERTRHRPLPSGRCSRVMLYYLRLLQDALVHCVSSRR